jgi:hypothetical protein
MKKENNLKTSSSSFICMYVCIYIYNQRALQMTKKNEKKKTREHCFECMLMQKKKQTNMLANN